MSEERYFRRIGGSPLLGYERLLSQARLPCGHTMSSGECTMDCYCQAWGSNPTTYSNEPIEMPSVSLEAWHEAIRRAREILDRRGDRVADHQDEQPRDEFTRDPWTEVGEPYGDDMPGMTLDEFQAWSDQIIREAQGDE